jgi:phosphopantothenoylcysteine synthetase/decarboxylase
MTIHIFGGGTIQHVRSHMALCAPARGRTARRLAQLLSKEDAQVQLHLTAMGDPDSDLETNEDVERRLREILAAPSTRGVIFNVALCDFSGQIGDIPSGKYAERLQTREVAGGGLPMTLRPTPKLLGLVRELRPDVKTVGFKTTAHESVSVQLARSNRMVNEAGVHLVLANDVGTRTNLVVPGTGNADFGATLFCGGDRAEALQVLASAFLKEVQRG